MCAVNGLNVSGPSSVQLNSKRLKELTRFIEFSVSAEVRIVDAADTANIAREYYAVRPRNKLARAS
jgi:hypothetical protein